MARQPTTDESRRRAALLAAMFMDQKENRELSVQEIADSSGLRYETVRALLSARSAGPSFFLVADLASALRISLNTLARETR
jgi:hypothetical protein